MAAPREVEAMREAIALAADPSVPLGPNPRVGCVLLAPDGAVVARGHHRGAGSAHAEVAALQAAGPQARGTTAVVTLEPCAHTGRTGPCADALLAAGVVRVVCAQADTSSAAEGGAQRLAASGVDVEGGVLAEEAAALNPEFTASLQLRRPFVTWKVAATLDGRVAARDGSSRWITGEPARADVHALRRIVDCVIVGTGTVLADDPQLTARDADGQVAWSPQPLRVVVGRRPVPAQARVLDDSAPTVALTTHDPHEVMAELDARGCHHALLEGGPTLAAAFVRAGLVDRVVAYVAPVLLGAGPSLVGDLGIDTIGEALRLDVQDVTVVGGDVRITARPLTQTSASGPIHPPARAAVPVAENVPDPAADPAPDTRGR